MPPSPHREIFVLLEQVAVSLVRVLREFADAALLDRGLNHAPRQIVEIHGLPGAALEDWRTLAASHLGRRALRSCAIRPGVNHPLEFSSTRGQHMLDAPNFIICQCDSTRLALGDARQGDSGKGRKSVLR